MGTLRAELTSVAEQVDRRLPDGQATITVTEEIRLKRTPTQRPWSYRAAPVGESPEPNAALAVIGRWS